MAAGAAAAADLIEPWDKGWSDLEFFVSASQASRANSYASLAGFGIANGVSVGTFVTGEEGAATCTGLVGIFTRPLSRRMEFDLWAEIGYQDQVSPDEGDYTLDGAAGTEWSLDLTSAVPYVRLAQAISEDESELTGLAGLMLPMGAMLELHLEMQTELRQGGDRSLRIGVGPNLRLRPYLELLPEISYISDRGEGENAWIATIGIIIDPRRPDRRLASAKERLPAGGSPVPKRSPLRGEPGAAAVRDGSPGSRGSTGALPAATRALSR
jgi:hypothetical protein